MKKKTKKKLIGIPFIILGIMTFLIFFWVFIPEATIGHINTSTIWLSLIVIPGIFSFAFGFVKSGII